MQSNISTIVAANIIAKIFRRKSGFFLSKSKLKHNVNKYDVSKIRIRLFCRYF